MFTVNFFNFSVCLKILIRCWENVNPGLSVANYLYKLIVERQVNLVEICLPISYEVKTEIKTIWPFRGSDALILFWKVLCNMINTPFGGSCVVKEWLLQQAWWLEACAASSSNPNHCRTWAVKQQVSGLKKSSGNPRVTVYYRWWILSSYVYGTQMEREWVGG